MSKGRVFALISSLMLASAGSAALAEEGHHWSYQGATGPAHWAALEHEFESCGIGHEQSPIDIKSAAAKKERLPVIAFAYHHGPLRMIDNGHTVQVNVPPGSSIDVGGHRYELVQFHFHKPSEEAIDGKHADMVAHLVHRDSDGKLAVVAVLLKAGDPNPFVALLWQNLPKNKGVEVEAKGVDIDPDELLPRDRAYFTFTGSLTTPPCSEGVTWYVLKHPATLSSGEIARFARLYPMNARPVQPLHGRVVRASE
ncbi:MAG TPA: carbonic anhydrase family protein [Caldimonas sp.]|nr:carbonic anhydrase family protein [Caldimonas sp.]